MPTGSIRLCLIAAPLATVYKASPRAAHIRPLTVGYKRPSKGSLPSCCPTVRANMPASGAVEMSSYAAAETMPLDFSMLLTSSSPRASGEFLHQANANYDTFLNDFGGPYACRRVASFPIANRHVMPKPSSLKVRSLSESAKLHMNNDAMTLNDLKRELSHLIEEEPPCTEQPTSDKKHSKISSKSADSSPPGGRIKKRVAFADDHGLDLVTVRVMNEPSDVPPKLSPSLLRHILGEAAMDEEAKPASSWRVDFQQPACEYLRFRQLLESQTVALENVVVKNDQCRMVGTIKVKNIAFEKTVFVRFTENNWQSFFDRAATFQPGIEGDIYDTFAFDVDIPCDDERRDRIEFCVCFQADGKEFWDSNDSKNYSLISQQLHERIEQINALEKNKFQNDRHEDAWAMHFSHWSNFASWKNLTTEGPYW